MAGNADLDGLFNPKSAAIVGISTTLARDNMAATYLKALVQCNFKGGIYPINPKGGEFRGFKVYPNVKDVPDSVDYVISCIPAPLVPAGCSPALAR